MSGQGPVDGLLDGLEAALQRLNDPRASLATVVRDHELAAALLLRIEGRLAAARRDFAERLGERPGP